eukprot:16259900-Heterocapsa_arctica.AAC.1
MDTEFDPQLLDFTDEYVWRGLMASAQHDMLLRKFGLPDGSLPPDLMFFPTAEGTVATKEAVVD